MGIHVNAYVEYAEGGGTSKTSLVLCENNPACEKSVLQIICHWKPLHSAGSVYVHIYMQVCILWHSRAMLFPENKAQNIKLSDCNS